MSLDWSLEGVQNSAELWKKVSAEHQVGFFETVVDEADGSQRVMDSVTSVLLFATMIVGIPQITEKNLQEFCERLEIAQSLQPFLRLNNGNPYRITVEDVRRRIGLSTNATPLSWAAFLKGVRQLAHDRIAREMRDNYKEHGA